MRAYRLEITPSAKKDLESLPKKTRQRVLEAVHKLAVTPRPRGCKKLQGTKDSYRIRVGDYRVIYEVSDEAVTVLIVRVRHRREAY